MTVALLVSLAFSLLECRVGGHTGFQLVLRVGEPNLDSEDDIHPLLFGLHVAGGELRFRGDIDHLPLVPLAGEGVDLYGNLLPQANLS